MEGSITPGYYQSTSHGTTILQRLAMTPVGRSAVLRFIRENAAEIKNHFGSSTSIGSVYSTVSSYASTDAELGTVSLQT